MTIRDIINFITKAEMDDLYCPCNRHAAPRQEAIDTLEHLIKDRNRECEEMTRRGRIIKDQKSVIADMQERLVARGEKINDLRKANDMLEASTSMYRVAAANADKGLQEATTKINTLQAELCLAGSKIAELQTETKRLRQELCRFQLVPTMPPQVPPMMFFAPPASGREKYFADKVDLLQRLLEESRQQYRDVARKLRAISDLVTH